MLKNKLKKAASVVLCFSMVATLQVPTLALASEEQDGEGAEETSLVSESYTQQSIADLYAAGSVADSDASVNLAVDEESNSLVVSGKKEALLASKITIGKVFNFDENAVGRFTVCGGAAKGKKVVLGFYLDDQAEPFYTTQLKPQTLDSWSDPAAKTGDVVAQDITGEHTLSIQVQQCSSDSSFSLSYIEFSESSLPVVNITIDESLGTVDAMNASSDHSVNCYGDLAIDVPEGCTSCMTGKALKGTDEALEMEYIRGRGNSTWDVSKKPYKLKLKSKANLLGMGKNKHWALMANAYDSSMMHNIMTSMLGNEVGMDYSPSMEPVELIMNGEYYGCYMLAEVTRLDSNRVDITDQDADDADTSDITGGYLLSLGNWELDTDKLNFTSDRAKGVFQIEAPDLYSKTDKAQYNYIKEYVQQVEDAIYAHDTEAYANLMDVTEAAKYYWFEELSKNGDGYTSGSCYLYKDKDGGAHGGKLCWGPIWDFDLAWGNESDALTATGWSHKNSFWNDELFKDQSFVDVVKGQWSAFKTALKGLYEDGGTLDTLYEKMKIAASYDYELWQGKGGDRSDSEFAIDEDSSESVPETASTALATAVSGCKVWLQARTKWVDSNLDSLDPEPVDVTYMVDGKVWKTVTEYKNCTISGLPEAPAKAGYTFVHWNYTSTYSFEDILSRAGVTEAEFRQSLIDNEDRTPEEADEYIAELKADGEVESGEAYNDMTVAPKMVFEAEYVLTSEIPSVTKVYTLQDTIYGVYYNDEDSQLEVPYETAPFNVQELNNGVTFASSNENVVKPAADEESNFLTVTGPGDAVVTIKPFKGTASTVKVHIYTQEEYEEYQQNYQDSNIGFAIDSITITKGSYAQIPFDGVPEGETNVEEPNISSTDDSVVEAGRLGVVRGVECGTATICCYNLQGNLTTCRVTVVDNKVHVGNVVKSGNLKYEVTSVKKSSRTVSCVGPVSKKLKKATVRNYVTIKGYKYKVTKVAADAFKNCKKLKTVVVGKNVQIVGMRAFKNCKKLRTVTFKSKLKPKVYASAFQGVSKKKITFKVPRGQKAYYKIVLNAKKIRTI